MIKQIDPVSALRAELESHIRKIDESIANTKQKNIVNIEELAGQIEKTCTRATTLSPEQAYSLAPLMEKTMTRLDVLALEIQTFLQQIDTKR